VRSRRRGRAEAIGAPNRESHGQEVDPGARRARVPAFGRSLRRALARLRAGIKSADIERMGFARRASGNADPNRSVLSGAAAGDLVYLLLSDEGV
jgi:hypothetical protein